MRDSSTGVRPQHASDYGWSDWGNAFPPGTYMGNLQVCPGSLGWSV
ncbi:MAG TPA: hypothetical protein VK283_02145 [Acidimicrobiales bacterium]|nr:hypothetical protein [Acidimicrobiales bacterium]